MFLQQLVNGLTLGSLYAVIAIGLTLVFGVLDIINMAHGGIFMIGAFVGLFMVVNFQMNIFVAIIVAMIVGAILGYLLEVFALRPLRRKKVSHLAPLISTIGVSIFLESLALLIWGPQTRTFGGTLSAAPFDFGIFKISMVQIIGLGVSVLLMIILNILIKKTKIGKGRCEHYGYGNNTSHIPVYGNRSPLRDQCDSCYFRNRYARICLGCCCRCPSRSLLRCD